MSASYCTVAEITTLGINPAALRDVDIAPKQAAIATASDRIDFYLRGQYVLPLLTWDFSIRRSCAVLAAVQLLRVRGTGPEDTETLDTIEGRELAWLRDVARGIGAPGVVDSSPSAKLGVPSSQPRIVSAPSQGFSRMPSGSPFCGRGGGGSFGS